MKTSVNTLDGLKRSLTVELPIESFNDKKDKIINNLSKSAKIDGFRKGKVPMAVLQQRFGGSASSDAANEIVNESLADALQDADIAPAGRPSLTKFDLDKKEIFSYTIEFEVFPEINIAPLQDLKIDQIDAEISDEDQNRSLKELQNRATKYKSVKRKSKQGDRLIIDFVGTIDGEAFEGGAAEGFELILGRGAMIAGFEQGLTNVIAGKDVEISATFPVEYSVPELSGKNASFKVKVQEVGSPKASNIDDSLAKGFGEKDLEAMKKRMLEQMQSELDERLMQQNKDAIFTALLEANKFDAPQGTIDTEARKLQSEMEEKIAQQGMPSNSKIAKGAFQEEASRRVKLGLLVKKIADDNDINVDNASIDAKLKIMASSYGENAQQMIDWYNEDPQRTVVIESLVKEEMVANLIAEKAKIKKTKKQFLEIMVPQK